MPLKQRLKKWLPDRDLNPDKQNQNLSCYRYTIGEETHLAGELAALTGKELEIAGFIWFQGWNDQYQDRWLTYEKNMANFIRNVRMEFKAPDMKFVIGQMGNDGMKPDEEGSPRDYIKKAQAAVPNHPEFKGNALCVRTDKYWDMEAHAIYTGPGG